MEKRNNLLPETNPNKIKMVPNQNEARKRVHKYTLRVH
jgi:hypothetical protein